MKIKAKILDLIRGMAMADGAFNYLRREPNMDPEDTDEKFWVNMMYLDDWFKTKDGIYYLGFDQETTSYVVEWRGHVRYPDGEKRYECEQVVNGPSYGYLISTAELLLKGIKNHKFYKKEKKGEA